MDFEINCGGVDIEESNESRRPLTAKLTNIDINDLVAAIGEDELLEAIGRDEAIKHFGIEEAE